MSKAIVLLSGGLDSTTTLAIAKSQSFDCYALSFDYGQKQVSELVSAKSIAKKAKLVVNVTHAFFDKMALLKQELLTPQSINEIFRI